MNSNEDIRSAAGLGPDETARRLVAEHGERLYATAVRLCRNAADAEDLVSRTLARAVEKVGTFAGRSAAFTWLCSIMVNFLRMDARRKGANALVFGEDMPEPEDGRPTPADTAEAADSARLVRALVRGLPDDMRAAVVLFYFRRMTVPEIAAAMGEPEGTVYYWLHEAKGRLREKLQEQAKVSRPAGI